MDKQRFDELLEYRDGKLYWKITKRRMKQGAEAGGVKGGGYKEVWVDNKLYKVHRLIFNIHHGYTPKYIDHINGDKLDNRVENLREVTYSQNNQNAARRVDNTSGTKGICWHKGSGKWVARIATNGVRVIVGYFRDIRDAERAIADRRNELHKEFANHG